VLLRWLPLAAIVACASAPRTEERSPRCELPAPEVVVRDGSAILVRWDLPDDARWSAESLPDDPRYAAYREAIREAAADLPRPIADEPAATTDEEREVWRREHANAELVFAGDAGQVRRVRCLDAALFAYQHARHDQLDHPTEFLAAILRRPGQLRVYLGASDVMFPPKSVYGLDQARRDVADGWQFAAHLHNHTLQRRAGKPALGVPAPSTNDVELLRGVASELGLQSVWVTNGLYTSEIPAAALARYHGRP
jgi:hypothetical protein